ncbi:MAG TPA: hypothetical protein VMF13_20525, partial [Luteitalea sp.]|nr:hypothetical protein [Luteitalea sp.]
VSRVREATARLAGAWADVNDGDDAARADVRLVVGDAGPVSARLARVPSDVAIRPSGAALDIVAISGPATAGSGSRVQWQVEVGGLPKGTGQLVLTIADQASGREEARETRAVEAGAVTRVSVPWLAVGEGPRRLRLRVGVPGRTDVREAVADVGIRIEARDPIISIVEARPAWGVRFARLALSGLPGLRVATEVRTAPGLTVRTGQDIAGDASLLMYGGVDALTRGDVDAAERAVRDGGRTAILVVDELPAGAGPWRRLWPDPVGQPVSVPRPRVVDVGGHAWKSREWLAVPLSTQVRPLAYSDTGSPVIAGRGMGAGRVVLVAALDAWRWRAEEGVAWSTGWQALVRRLAADVPPPVTVSAWTAGEGRERVVQADVRVRPDVSPGATPTATMRTGSGAAVALPLWSAGAGRWRGAIPAPGDGRATIDVTATVDGAVVQTRPVVVDLSAAITPGTWSDVVRTQRARGSEAVEETDLAAALDRWRQAHVAPAGARWHVSRQWWFAGLVLGVLGSEWILRRARRLP